MTTDPILQPGESLDDLQVSGYHIIQSEKHFKFSIDAVLLSHFATIKDHAHVMDMCSGTGIVGTLLCAHTTADHIDCVEIQDELSDMCRRSIEYNQANDRMRAHCMDLKDTPMHFGYEQYDAVVCNPPYQKLGSGKQNDAKARLLARFEVACTLDDVIRSAASLVKNKGRIALSHRPERLADIITQMRQYRIEPKRLQLVHSKAGEDAVILLIEGIKNGNPGMTMLPPLMVYDASGKYSTELLEIYHMT